MTYIDGFVAAVPQANRQAYLDHATKAFAVTLPSGPYRFRTIEAGAEVDAQIGDDGAIPEIVAWNGDLLLRSPSHKGEFVIHNDTDQPLFFVIEDRAWAKDALTGERVISMVRPSRDRESMGERLKGWT